MAKDEKVVVSGYVSQELAQRLDALLFEDETRSEAVAQAVETEVKIREHAAEEANEAQEVSRDTQP